MPEPISTSVGICLTGYATLITYLRSQSAISFEAGLVTNKVYALMGASEQSNALWGHKADAISQVMAIAKDCAEADWNGEGASAIDPQAISNTWDFIRAMSCDLPMPEFAPEPDGSISLDWIPSRHRIFSLSIGRGNRLAYAWLDGTDKGRGVAYFDGLSIPSRVLEGIRSIATPGATAIRIA